VTEQEIRDWLKENLDAKLREFGLSHWRVDVEFCRLESEHGSSNAECDALPEYERATIRFDLNALLSNKDDLDDVINTVEHEICHIVTSPHTNGLKLIERMVHPDHHAAFHEAHRQSCEMVIRNMERMAYGIRETLTAKYQVQFEEVCKERDALKEQIASLEEWGAERRA
jgi:hypothetical protein